MPILLASIITPSFNSARFLPETIASVRAQTLAEWEHLIIDDASTDDTCRIVEEFAAIDGRIRLLRSDTNLGPGVARNRGIEAARGRYIAFLDSDDFWFPEKLEKQLAFMAASGAAVSHTDYERIAEDGSPIGRIRCPDMVGERELLRSFPVKTSTGIYDSAQTGRVYMPSIRKRQDWGLWLRLAGAGFSSHNVGEILTGYRIRKNSVSSNKLIAALYTWRHYREVMALSPAAAAFRMAQWTAVVLWRYTMKHGWARMTTRTARRP